MRGGGGGVRYFFYRGARGLGYGAGGWDAEST